jgi:CRP-like cAMP-binding protein
MQAESYTDAGQSCSVSILNALGAGQVRSPEKVRAFWQRIERYGPGAQVQQDLGARSKKQLIIVSGWACDLRILPDGRRQIFSFLLPGDAIEARGAGNVGSRGLVALTRLELVDSGRQLAADAEGRDALIQALNDAALRREQRLYDHVVRMGRLSAKERVIHLLLELRERLEPVGLVKGDTFKIPLTQEIFADALGLSVVHINRTLKELRKEGLVCVKSGSATLLNPERLATMSCYITPSDNPGAEAGSWRESPDSWGLETGGSAQGPFGGPGACAPRSAADRSLRGLGRQSR